MKDVIAPLSNFRGLQPVADDEVKALYEGIHVPVDYMNTFYGVVSIFI